MRDIFYKIILNYCGSRSCCSCFSLKHTQFECKNNDLQGSNWWLIFQLCSLRWNDAVVKSVFWLSDFASEKPMKHSIIAARQVRSSKPNLVRMWAWWSSGCKPAGMFHVGQWHHNRVSRMEAGAMAVWLQPSSIPFLRRVSQLSCSHCRLVGNLVVGYMVVSPSVLTTVH